MRLSLSPVKLAVYSEALLGRILGLKAPCARGLFYSALWSLVEHARPLPDGQSNAGQAFDLTLERRTRFIQVDAGIEHALDLGAVNFRLIHRSK